MKILIVDDNKNNRMILRLLLEDYVEDNNLEEFDISEAEDGLIALDMCKAESYQLIFMDIMMPNMDGIEATKEIRKIDPKTMIIAVSAVDDGERKKLILSNGAEDYISKPVNADIFVNRITNYLVLIDSRTHTSKENIAFVNLYTNEIYSRHTKFILNTEDALAEFWEFFLLNARMKSDHLSDVVRAIISIVEKQINISNTNLLYIEESESKQYFTLTGIEVLPPKVIDLLLMKNGIKENFILEENKLSFELLKVTYKEDEDFGESSAVVAETSATPEVISKPVVETIVEEEIASPIDFEASKNLETFDYMEDDDLYDLEEYAAKLNSIMLVVGSGGVTEEEVVEIYGYLDRLGSILSTYSEVYPISQALVVLSSDMSAHIDEFIVNSEALGPMCKAFSNDMSKWIQQSFHTGAPSADFMNDTIVVNCQTIGGMLKINDEVPAGDDDFDDIFDF